MLRRIRIAILLLVLLIVGAKTLLDSYDNTRWDAPFVVALYPINGDGSPVAEQSISTLSASDFAPLEKFFDEEAHEYGLALDRPMRFTLAAPLNARPPLPPPHDANVIFIMLWSLHLRWWAWITPPKPPGPTPRIRMFLLFHDPERSPVLEHSTGLSKGRLGIANLFASKREVGSNHTVIAHELLHTLGATDKYDLTTTLPRYPDGFAEPEVIPRYPQRFAELMAGRIAISASEARIPESLDQVLIGPATAREIGWKKR